MLLTWMYQMSPSSRTIDKIHQPPNYLPPLINVVQEKQVIVGILSSNQLDRNTHKIVMASTSLLVCSTHDILIAGTLQLLNHGTSSSGVYAKSGGTRIVHHSSFIVHGSNIY